MSELNKQQKKALKLALRGTDLFITGGAGTGKSYVLRTIISELQAVGKRVVVCAPTGIAALNVNGVTIHRAFGFTSEAQINIGNGRRSSSIKTRTSGPVKNADVVIIDEISMVRMDLYDSVVASIKKIEQKQQRKIQLIVAGDFFQLPPVIAGSDREILASYYKRAVGHAFAFQAPYWTKRQLTPIILTEIIRQDDKDFMHALNKLRVGDSSCKDYFNMKCGGSSEEGIHLYATNKRADARNSQMLNLLDGPSMVSETEVHYMPGYNETNVDPSILTAIPKDLELKRGARVLITTNAGRFESNGREITPDHRWVKDEMLFANGTLATFQDLYTVDGLSYATLTLNNGKIIELDAAEYPIYDYIVNGDDVEKVQVATYTQLPLKLAYAITIHRSQGQTYDYATIFPWTFAHGQIYVAISRVKTPEGVHLMRKINNSDIIVDPSVVEFYRDLEDIAAGRKRKKMGRPTKNENGEKRDVLVWVPMALADHVKREVENNKAIPLAMKPLKKSMPTGRKHMRIPKSLEEHVKNEIANFKNQKLL